MLEVSVKWIRKENSTGGGRIGKESSCGWCESIRQTLLRVRMYHCYSVVAGYEISIEKSITVRDVITRERVSCSESPFTVATRKIKYLVINVPRTIQNLYEENINTHGQDMKVEAGCSWKGWLNAIHLPVLPKQTYKFNVIPIEMPKHFSP